jgi:hypothetical protein
VIFVDQIPETGSGRRGGQLMLRGRGWLFAAAGIAAAGCASPTVTPATEKPIEIKIDLRTRCACTSTARSTS